MEKLLIQKFPYPKHSLQSKNKSSFFLHFILVVNNVTRQVEMMTTAITKLAQQHHNSVSKHAQSHCISLDFLTEILQAVISECYIKNYRNALLQSDDTRGCICTICVDLLMMSRLRSKHVEEFNFM